MTTSTIYKDKSGRLICGRKTRSGGLCSNVPGHGTPFKGKPGIPCARHGGLVPVVISSAAKFPTSKDLSFHVVDELLRSRADAFANDPDLMSLKREVGLCRAKLESLEGKNDFESASITASLSSIIGRLIERIHRMEMERSGLVQIGLVRLLVDSWQRAIMEVIADINLRNILSNRMLDLSRSKLALIAEVSPSRQLIGTNKEKVAKESATEITEAI